MYRSRLLTVGVTVTCSILLVSVSVAEDLACPAMPDKITQVNRDVRSEVSASVGSLGKLKAGEVGVKTDVVAKNLFEKYPNTDRIIVVQMMAATYCSLLRDSKTVRDSEKLRLWEEFSERVFKFANPNYNPTPQQVPKPKRRATPDHKGSPVPTNSSGSTNNGTETELHAGRQGPPLGSNDTLKTDATVATEVRRAKPTIEFDFPTTGERKQKFHVHNIRPNLIQIEPKRTGVKEDDLPMEVPVVGGTITVLRFGEEDDGGYILFDTSQMPRGTRIRGEVLGYNETQKPPLPHQNPSQGTAPSVQDNPNVNSVLENSGEVNNVEISGPKVSAPEGGRATIVENLPGGKATDIRVKNPTISSNSNSQNANDNPAMEVGRGPGLHRFIIEDIEYCDSDEAAIGVLPGGKIENGLIRNNIPLNCDWVDVLGYIVGDRKNIKPRLDKFSQGLEKTWESLPESARNKNRMEWAQIRDQLMNASGDALTGVTNKLTMNPPHFDVSVARLSMYQK